MIEFPRETGPLLFTAIFVILVLIPAGTVCALLGIFASKKDNKSRYAKWLKGIMKLGAILLVTASTTSIVWGII